ncbi:hypothetical protein J6590_011385 [Homalodisca vitripennis]|nr:hypothetical protein J6590_011385 [Homalodisca vitripennis]
MSQLRGRFWFPGTVHGNLDGLVVGRDLRRAGRYGDGQGSDLWGLKEMVMVKVVTCGGLEDMVMVKVVTCGELEDGQGGDLWRLEDGQGKALLWNIKEVVTCGGWRMVKVVTWELEDGQGKALLWNIKESWRMVKVKLFSGTSRKYYKYNYDWVCGVGAGVVFWCFFVGLWCVWGLKEVVMVKLGLFPGTSTKDGDSHGIALLRNNKDNMCSR